MVCLCNYIFGVCAKLHGLELSRYTSCYYIIVMQQDHRNAEVLALSSFEGVVHMGQSLLILAR